MRPSNPGDRIWRGIMDPGGVHNRTITAIVDDISEENGYVTLDFDGLPSVGRPATIPWIWASFPTPGEGAWGRYMPFKGDVMKVAFDYDNTPRIAGYDTKAQSPEVADGKSGWPRISNAASGGSLPQFPVLQSGEYDFMSVGGAYIKGTATGQLMLTAGAASIVLTGGTTNLLSTEARHYTIVSGTNKIRYGQVCRKVLDLPGEVAGVPEAIWNPDGSLAEFQVQISKTIGPIGLNMALLSMGSITSEEGLIEISDFGSPLRFAIDISDPTGINTVGGMNIDAAGNIDITATILDVNAVTIDLGADASGGVLNGSTLSSQMSIAFQTLQAALSVAEGTPPLAPAPGAALVSLATALDQFTQVLKNAIDLSTSKTVQVQA